MWHDAGPLRLGAGFAAFLGLGFCDKDDAFRIGQKPSRKPHVVADILGLIFYCDRMFGHTQGRCTVTKCVRFAGGKKVFGPVSDCACEKNVFCITLMEKVSALSCRADIIRSQPDDHIRHRKHVIHTMELPKGFRGCLDIRGQLHSVSIVLLRKKDIDPVQGSS